MRTFQEFMLECHFIVENVTSGRPRRSRIGIPIESRPRGPISNQEFSNIRQKKSADTKSQIQSAGEEAHKKAIAGGVSPAEAETARKRAEFLAQKEIIKSKQERELKNYKGVNPRVTKHNR